jgi:hypothetical protein
LLSQGVVDFINSTRGVGIKEGKVNVSKIYNCFQTEFGETGQDVLMHLLKYAKPKLKKQLQAIGQISNFTYDWNINAAQKVSN